MKILSWNYRGLGNPCIVNTLHNWCGGDSPNIVFLMETMIDKKALENLWRRCGFENSMCVGSYRHVFMFAYAR